MRSNLQVLAVAALISAIGMTAATGASAQEGILAKNASDRGYVRGLDVTNAATHAGARIQLWDYFRTAQANQNWYFHPSPDYPGYFTISNGYGMCLDVKDASAADEALVQQWWCHGGKNQLWTIPHRERWGLIINFLSGKCLDIRYGAHGNGAVIQQFRCHNPSASNQQWQINYYR